MSKELNKATYKYQFMTATVSEITQAANDYGVTAEPLYVTDTKQLYIHDGDEFIPVVRAKDNVPSSASDGGVKGEVAVDDDYLYVCIAEDTWKRVAISSW
jgi:hypothetical protein